MFQYPLWRVGHVNQQVPNYGAYAPFAAIPVPKNGTGIEIVRRFPEHAFRSTAHGRRKTASLPQHAPFWRSRMVILPGILFVPANRHQQEKNHAAHSF